MSKRVSAALSVTIAAVLLILSLTLPMTLVGAITEQEQTRVDNLNDEIEQLEKEIAQNQQALADLETQKSTTQTSLNTLLAQVTNLQSQIDALSAKISLLNQNIAILNNQISATQTEIDKIQGQITDQEKEIDNTYVLLKERLRAMYMAGETSSLEILLGSDSLETLLTRVELVRSVSAHDTKLIDEIKDEITKLQSMKKDLTAKKTQLDSQKQQLEASKANLVTSKSALSTQKTALDKKVSALNTKMKSLNASSSAYKKAAAKLEAQKSAFEDMVDDIIAGRSSTGSGSVGELIWPLPYSGTYITSTFGTRTLNGTTSTHRGIDISMPGAAALNKRIVASASGVVLYAGYNEGGYGYYIIIDHGNAVFTVYGHCNQLFVSTGNVVSQGDTIAILGNTGRSTGPHLHFEIRLKGSSKYSAVNPLSVSALAIPSDVYFKK